MKVEEGQLTVQRPGQKTTQTTAVGAGVFDGIKNRPRLGGKSRQVG
uniref:IncF plasmid conjugative transfer DNA-nicking and unwinding protein TraI n=1 Tax=Klebsiella pneumoniae TaxID=573 RepID=A0A8B0SUL1_KLEPN|nr:IncF plasmid conjugative transfer DNA-nicking and unwinding protein TraI [Klebsiella pneumoniae]